MLLSQGPKPGIDHMASASSSCSRGGVQSAYRRWCPKAPTLPSAQPSHFRRGGFHYLSLHRDSPQCRWDRALPACTHLSGALLLRVDSECSPCTSWPWGPGTKLPPTAQPTGNILPRPRLSHPLPFPDHQTLPAAALVTRQAQVPPGALTTFYSTQGCITAPDVSFAFPGQ